jgi:hypothetical protein
MKEKERSSLVAALSGCFEISQPADAGHSGTYNARARLLARDVHLRARGSAVKLIGVLLIVFGILALAIGRFTYTKREKVLDIGPIQATADRRETVLLSPLVGLGSIAGGVALVVLGADARSRARE